MSKSPSAIFSAKLELALKILSMTRSQLAAELGVDKSVAGRWVSGAVRPSAHNLSQLTAMIARRVPGFTILDWERDLDALALRLGADASALKLDAPPVNPLALTLSCLPQVLATTALRGSAYEGFFRSTRVWARLGDQFIHDYTMMRLGGDGLLRMTMVTAGIYTDGWVLPLHNQLYCVGCERATGTPVFGIFHAAGGLNAKTLDGLILTSIHDVGRTPTAAPSVLHRIGDLSGDAARDEATLAEYGKRNPVSSLEEVPAALREHLCRDIGPAAAALGGEMLMQMPLARSITN
jgi:hypothetical protein